MTHQQQNEILEKMVELLELPESAYEKAKKRYDDLGQWFDREDSTLKDFNPHVFPQGSFRLGTAIRPLDEKEEYDLDLACKLREGVTKYAHTQEQVKTFLQKELEAYRIARGIKAPLDEKHRCWRLEYQDDLNFHMDIVPCIPEDTEKQHYIFEAIQKSGIDSRRATAMSETTISITDNRASAYKLLSPFWNISNPEGYAEWFQNQMAPSRYQTGMMMEKAQIDKVPLFKQKTPLQRAIQLLKRHRDNMFKDDPEVKPISIIITTLATRAYEGETDLQTTLSNILAKMGELVHPNSPRVPNPVDPDEDFADRWSMSEYKHLKLEENFWLWLKQAQIDFENIISTSSTGFITEQAKTKFALTMGEQSLASVFGLASISVADAAMKPHMISQPAKPHMEE